MKNILLLAVGAGIGFIAAHQLSKTEQGARFFAEVENRAREFGDAVVDGYKAREAELRAAVAEAEDALDDRAQRAQ